MIQYGRSGLEKCRGLGYVSDGTRLERDPMSRQERPG
jgi:hypothetical protein